MAESLSFLFLSFFRDINEHLFYNDVSSRYALCCMSAFETFTTLAWPAPESSVLKNALWYITTALVQLVIISVLVIVSVMVQDYITVAKIYHVGFNFLVLS